ncbi:glycoside hydrolase family 88 protein [Algisphaera agarilytica]|uniref:Rhamnogalacturonyl hydrolase YesR n=1 Tax=Algisphaera agarilytica TaxID=1385975 RepID=A0A7X0H4P2_9BACT|nr:glycoside hydrolase family 88 protein [Algisphaera agarilytica]MBB6429237.1 rhamnogalacturonyl hydrolase YesR [Algisphaera agarilytica]
MAKFAAVVLLAATWGGVVCLADRPAEAQPGMVSQLQVQSASPEAVRDTMRRVAEYQLDRYGPEPPTRNWLVGTFFTGMIEAYHATGDAWYLEESRAWGERSGWGINNPVHADDVCPGQTYLELYFIDEDPAMLTPLVEAMEPLLERETIEPGELNAWQKEAKPWTGRNLWWWCDALYMAPPVYARLGTATGDRAYHEAMHELFWDTADYLYDPNEHLFYRDGRYLPKGDGTDEQAEKVFWSRGNGWVFAGLVRILEHLPEDDPQRQRYLELFRDMAMRIVSLQQDDGLWRSWMNNPAQHPTKESTGSAFFVYGLAKGVSEGWLPQGYYESAILRGWTGLLSCVTPEGRVTHAQMVGYAPTAVRPWDTMDYGAGALLLAAAAVAGWREDGLPTNPPPGEFLPRVVAEDGAFTWYNDERAVVMGNLLYVNYVKRDGMTALSSFAVSTDIEKPPAPNAKREVLLSTWTEKDDHNNGSLLPLPDGRLLATYAKHGTSKSFYQRYITPKWWNPPVVSDERAFEVTKTKRGLTYQNLFPLSDEGGRIYNFFRGNNFNPNFVTSDDLGETWSDPHLLVSAGENSNQRPYVKYVHNGKDRFDLLYTDGHPRDLKANNVYHLYYFDGAFRRSDGTVIRTMDQIVAGDSLAAEEGTLVFDGSGASGRGWVWDLEYDRAGQPYGAFISSPSGDIGTDMRYWTARLIDGEWQTEEIAFAGSNLYPKEQHYAGGIALDPHDDQRVVVSADVHPATNEPLPGRVYQLFKGTKSENGDWDWEQLTFDPVNHQLRPVLVRDRPETLVWFAGEYATYADYRCKVMASFGY